MRFHRPIGIFILLWPTLWALWLSSYGHPNVKVVVIFILGVIVTRALGCVINDIADRDFDKHVARTHDRPLTAGKISLKGAWVCFFILGFIALFLVLQLNIFTICLSFGALFFAILYPFTKRWLPCPQVFLSIPYGGFPILMAFAAQTNHVSLLAVFLFLLQMIWTVIYDTEYAMVDRDDDVKIGIKSTAILFGQYDVKIIGLLQIAFIAGFIYLGYWQNLHGSYYCALIIAASLFIYQQYLISNRDRSNCFKAFLNNNYVGLVIFLGLVIN